MNAPWEKLWYPHSAEAPSRQLGWGPLTLAEVLFGAGVAVRNGFYDRGLLRSERVAGPRIISVGNITVGGAGKTPAVIYLAGLLSMEKRKVAVLSRGYGRSSNDEVLVTPLTPFSQAGDEPVLIARRCPSATVLVGSNRVALAKRARDQYGAEVVLLDDGMQYRQLARDLDIAVVDEAVGFGNGRLLPRGPLREPIKALRRASLLWLRSADRAIRGLPSLPLPYVRASYAPAGLLSPSLEPRPVTSLQGRAVFALAGIARPSAFLHTLRQLGMEVVGSRFFQDHHRFRPLELDQVLREAKALGTEVVATTEKDQVRLPPGFPVWTVRMEVDILEGRDILADKLGLLQRRSPPG